MSSFYPPFGNASAQRLCQRCGRPLPPNEVSCGNCGHYYNTLPEKANTTAAAQSPSATSWGNAGATPQASFGANQFGGPQWRPFPSNGFAQPFAAGPQADYQPQAFTWPPEGKSGPQVGRIILVAVLLLVIIGGLIGGGVIFLMRHNTGTPSSTPTTSNIAPTAVPKGSPIFQDAFTDNKNGWDTTSEPGVFSVKVGNGSLVLEDDNNRLLWELVPRGRNFNDFFLTVDTTLSRGTQDNGYGIYIRGASNQNVDIATYYRFEIYGDGTFAIFIGKVDASGASKSSPIMSNSFSPAIHKSGQVNHIAISAKGSSMTFLVNGQVLKTFTATTYTAGTIALFVSNLTPPGAQATFSNLVVYPPQS